MGPEAASFLCAVMCVWTVFVCYRYSRQTQSLVPKKSFSLIWEKNKKKKKKKVSSKHTHGYTRLKLNMNDFLFSIWTRQNNVRENKSDVENECSILIQLRFGSSIYFCVFLSSSSTEITSSALLSLSKDPRVFGLSNLMGARLALF